MLLGSWKLYKGEKFQGHPRHPISGFSGLQTEKVHNLFDLTKSCFLVTNGPFSLWYFLFGDEQPMNLYDAPNEIIWILWLVNTPKEVETDLHGDASFGKNALVSRGEAILGAVLRKVASCEHFWHCNTWSEKWVTLYSNLCAETKEHEKNTSNESIN